MEERHDQIPEDSKITPEELGLYMARFNEMLQDLERREHALALKQQEVAWQQEKLKGRNLRLMTMEAQLVQEKKSRGELVKKEEEIIPPDNLKEAKKRLERQNKHLSHQVQELEGEILPKVEQGLSILQIGVGSKRKLRKNHKQEKEAMKKDFSEQKERLEQELKLGAERVRSMERVHIEKVHSLEQDLASIKKEMEELQAFLEEEKTRDKILLKGMKEENSKLKEKLELEKRMLEEELQLMKRKNNEILRMSKEKDKRILELEEDNTLLHEIIDLDKKADQLQLGQVRSVSASCGFQSQEEKKNKEETSSLDVIGEDKIKDMEKFIVEDKKEKEIVEDKEKEKNKQVQLSPGTYEEELKNFNDHLEKIKDNTKRQKARDILTAVGHGKTYGIVSDKMLADTLFLTNQFLIKIISDEEITKRMCFDYQTLADNFNKTPLSEKIAGAMIAFLGAIVVGLRLPFIKPATGFHLLRKGIKLMGTQSLAENSADFLKEIKKPKLAK